MCDFPRCSRPADSVVYYNKNLCSICWDKWAETGQLKIKLKVGEHSMSRSERQADKKPIDMTNSQMVRGLIDRHRENNPKDPVRPPQKPVNVQTMSGVKKKAVKPKKITKRRLKAMQKGVKGIKRKKARR